MKAFLLSVAASLIAAAIWELAKYVIEHVFRK